MRLRMRLIAVAVAAAAVLGPPGCATVRQVIAPKPGCENPMVVPVADFDAVWRETIAVLDEYFDVRSENRLAGTIVTDPVVGATLLEPWRADSVGLDDRLESTLQTMRRFALVQIKPAPGRGYLVKVEVMKELEFLAKPDKQTAGRAVFNNDFPVNRTREVVGPIPAPVQWIPRGRDSKLEQVILNRIRDALFL